MKNWEIRGQIPSLLGVPIFEEDGEGEFEFIAKSKWHSIQFHAYKTKRSFSAEFLVIK